MQIAAYTPDNAAQWREYLEKHPKATLFHTLGWREAVVKTFQHQPHYLYAHEEGDIVGVLPLFQIKSRLWGHSLVSVPFGVYGGICADNEPAERELFKAAVTLGKKLGTGHIELKETIPLENIDGLVTKDLYVTFDLELFPDHDIIWKGMRKRNRNILRKGLKSGLELYKRPGSWSSVDMREMETFYNLFARTQTALGTPVLPWKWFLNLAGAFPEQLALFSTSYKGNIVNSLLVLRYKDTLLPYYIGYDPEYLRFAPNNYILWEAIQFGCIQGFKHFDLGRSRQGTGSYSFKVHWGIEPRQLYYQYHLYPGHEMPNLNPSNPKFALAKKIWSRLPMPVVKAVSPGLVKFLG